MLAHQRSAFVGDIAMADPEGFGAVSYLKPEEAVQLCRSLRFRGAYLYDAAAETRDELIGVTAIIK